MNKRATSTPANVAKFKSAMQALNVSGKTAHIQPGNIAPHPVVGERLSHVQDGQHLRVVRVTGVSASGETITVQGERNTGLNYDVSRWNLQRE